MSTPVRNTLAPTRFILRRWWPAVVTAAALAAPTARAGDDPYNRYNPALAAAKAAVADGQTVRSRQIGSGGSRRFEDLPAEGAVLIGFELGVGRFVSNEVIHTVRPLFWTAHGDTPGQQHGTAQPVRTGNRRVKSSVERVVTVKARPGYAVAGVNARSGLLIDGLSVRFARVDGRGLDLSETYTSEWVGGRTGRSPTALDGDGALPIGVFGQEGDQNCPAFGLILLKTEAPAAAEPTPPPTRPQRARSTTPKTPTIEDLLSSPPDLSPRDPALTAAVEASPRPAPALVVPGKPEAETGGIGWVPILTCGFVTLGVFAVLLVPALRKGLAAPVVSKEERDLLAPPAPAAHQPPTAPLPASARIGFGRRLGALVIDTIVIVIGGAAFAAAGAMLGVGAGRSLAAGLGSPAQAADVAHLGGVFGGIFGAVVAFGVGVSLISIAFMVWEGLTGAALGKRLLHIRIRAADGSPAPTDRLLLRAGIKYSSRVCSLAGLLLGSSLISSVGTLAGLVVFFGCLLVLGQARQALHDLAAGTAVYPDEAAG
jgi:uncharacterized RDD family membrane protein YckC